MQKVIEKCLKVNILKQIGELNKTNNQFHTLLQKLKLMDFEVNEKFTQKMELMKNDIKDKIKHLAENVDLMYQVFDKKINILIRNVQNNPTLVEEQLRINLVKIKELEDVVKENQKKYNAVLTQNQYLKNRNMCLIEELQSINKKKANNSTSDSSNRNIILKNDGIEDTDLSLENHGSPIQQNVHVNFKNDLTFNEIARKTSPKKCVKSEQNSFSQLLIKQQNSFSYGTDHIQIGKNLGCLSGGGQGNESNTMCKGSSTPQPNFKKQVGNQDHSHRLNFLLTNLKDSSEESFVSQSSQFHHQRDQSASRSVLSKCMVKKYHI